MNDLPRQPWLDRAKKHTAELFAGTRNVAFSFSVVVEPSLFTGLEAMTRGKENLWRAYPGS